MNLPFIADKTYKNQDYTVNNLPKAEYDNCTFINCDFSESYLSTISFLECEFVDCNFSSAKVKDVTFKEVVFNNCKLLGVPFHDCNPMLMSFSFIKCSLNLSSFFNLKQLKATHFTACTFEQTDFTNTNLSLSIFNNCNFYQTIFENTNLEKADLSTSKKITLDPNKNRVKDAIFSKENALGLLAVFQLNIK